ncbi:phospholipase D3-like [Ctenocephalides felis]|uniref:phospholipase D3-like n=1 Tax=Ctenocephalides felis TaxID=7515 RepID=UPI000E6E3213|nr:phospholipase D3-like [Ctenocephalides felis]
MKMNYEADLACNEARRNSFKKNRERRKLDIQNSADSKGIVENEISSFSPISADDDLWERTQMLRQEQEESRRTRWICKPSCLPISIILILIVLVVLLPLLDHSPDKLHVVNRKIVKGPKSCEDNCQIHLTETIPEGLIYPVNSIMPPSTYESWMNLINAASETIDIASFYWTLRLNEVHQHASSQKGEDIFQALKAAGSERNITLRIAQNIPNDNTGPNSDTETLALENAATVKSLNFTNMVGGGVLHTKLWIIDKKHIYLGSANMDWRSLTQVKEMGIVAYDCPCLANDIAKIFDVYWLAAEANSTIPKIWPENLATEFNIANPMHTVVNNISYGTYISSSPPPMSTMGRTDDIDSILNVIANAKEFIYIAVMDYFPLTIYTPTQKFWPIIDNALRKAAIENNVRVFMLISWWKHSRPTEDNFLRSLVNLSGVGQGNKTVDIQVKRFVVPASPEQNEIPFARVNHNKYMVTDNTAYIGTSNWSGDYFINTAGIGFILEDIENKINETENIKVAESLRKQLLEVFERDWYSVYAKNLFRQI